MQSVRSAAVSATAFHLPPDRLRDITDFCDAIELMEELGYCQPSDIEDITGFGQLHGQRKEELLGKSFVILEMRIRQEGLDGYPFAEMLVVTLEDGRKLKLRDSSKGICSQVRAIIAGRIHSNHPNPYYFFMVKGGLKYKDNPYYDEENRKEILSRTYFLDYQ